MSVPEFIRVGLINKDPCNKAPVVLSTGVIPGGITLVGLRARTLYISDCATPGYVTVNPSFVTASEFSFTSKSSLKN